MAVCLNHINPLWLSEDVRRMLTKSAQIGAHQMEGEVVASHKMLSIVSIAFPSKRLFT